MGSSPLSKVVSSVLITSFCLPILTDAFPFRDGWRTRCLFVNYDAATSFSQLQAKPSRLEDNVDGVLYVNDRCINCAACSAFAPRSFRRSDTVDAHIVYKQPSTLQEIDHARAAMAACSVAAIRVETLAQLRHAATNINTKQAVEDAWTEADQNLVDNLSRSSDKPFPRHFLNDNTLPVYWLGHHNEASFGATPYLLQTTLHNGESVSIMIDTPRYSKSSVAAVESITGAKGPDFLVLTHVDDTVDHGKWKEHYKNHLRRIFHSGDLGPHNWLGDKTLEEVEILLHGSVRESSSNLTAYRLDGTQLVGDWLSGSSRDDDVVILHTPGHSPGSITLWDRVNKILFTGDTYAWTTREGGHMSGFPRYGNNLTQQSDTLNALIAIPDWRIIAPGHGHPRDYRNETDDVINEEAVIAREELGRRLR